jgi:hypothetical protein
MLVSLAVRGSDTNKDTNNLTGYQQTMAKNHEGSLGENARTSSYF